MSTRAITDRAWGVALVTALLLAATAIGFSGCLRRPAAHSTDVRLANLRTTREALHSRIEDFIDRDTFLASALAESAEVVLALPGGIIHDMFHEVARSYFDRVDLSLEPDNLDVNEEGELRVKTFLGKMSAGSWKVHLTIHQLRGSLSAGSPTVTVTHTNRLHMTVPAHLMNGSGSGTLHFDWDPKGLANLVCRPYSTTQDISGQVIPRDYILKGDFILAAGQDNLMADPEFPPDKFVISVNPSDQTWAAVREDLKSQDKLFRCGLVFDPDDVITKLKGLGERGFKVKLPRTLFRPVSLPASISKSVHVGSKLVELSVSPNVLRVTPTTFWYSASVNTQTSIPDSTAQGAPADTIAAISGPEEPSAAAATRATSPPR